MLHTQQGLRDKANALNTTTREAMGKFPGEPNLWSRQRFSAAMAFSHHFCCEMKATQTSPRCGLRPGGLQQARGQDLQRGACPPALMPASAYTLF